MRLQRFERRKKINNQLDDNESREDSSTQSYSSARLRLHVVQPGKYVAWGNLGSLDGPHQLWELSKAESGTSSFDTEDKNSDNQSEDDDRSSVSSQNSHKYDDPMLNVMWQEVQAEKKVNALIDFKLEQDRIQWASSRYKLTSLEGKGDVELIRLLLVYSGENFEDERITSDQWEEMKHNAPYHSLPILSKCGKQWGDTGAIVRVLARRYLLMGISNDEHLVVEATYERLRRLKRQNERAINWVITGEKNKEKQEWAQSQLLHVVLPPAMKEWEQLITKTRGPYSVESGVTMADLAIMDFLDQCSSCMMIDNLFSDHLAVADLYSMVRLFPKIAEYLDERAED